MALLSVVTYQRYGRGNRAALEHVRRELILVCALISATNQDHPRESPYGTMEFLIDYKAIQKTFKKKQTGEEDGICFITRVGITNTNEINNGHIMQALD